MKNLPPCRATASCATAHRSILCLHAAGSPTSSIALSDALEHVISKSKRAEMLCALRRAFSGLCHLAESRYPKLRWWTGTLKKAV